MYKWKDVLVYIRKNAEYIKMIEQFSDNELLEIKVSDQLFDKWYPVWTTSSPVLADKIIRIYNKYSKTYTRNEI